MSGGSQGITLVQIVVLLGAGVAAVPLFKRLGLGAVLGYFCAGVAVGPFGLRLLADPLAILHVAEFGVVMLLFVIGLEMHPRRLWAMRRQVFGLGAAQVLACGLLLTGAGLAWGLAPAVAFVAAAGFVLTSTAVVMQVLDDQGETSTPQGQEAVAILLLEDLAIVPLLATVALLAPEPAAGAARPGWVATAVALVSVLALAAVGRWLLNPIFRLLAAARAREVMTAAALLVVLGAALLMDWGGWSMAMGAFLAGVLLSESAFRHQLEADIEPFRGILLGLFFLAVGMALDLAAIAAQWRLILVATLGFVAIKALGIYGVARLFGAGRREALARAALFAQGGEFAFVLYAAAAGTGLFDVDTHAVFTAAAILSMAATPPAALAIRRLLPPRKLSLDGIAKAQNLTGDVLVIGFGRFGQVLSQILLARGFEVSIIETNVELIQAAVRFGFKVHYGDGTRLDILRASGAGRCRAVLVCVDKAEAATRIAHLVKAEFPLAPLFVRANDRGHAIELIRLGVDYQLRETFESAMTFGEAVLRALDVPETEVEEISDDVRRRDAERLELQVAVDPAAGDDSVRTAGTDLVLRNAAKPQPVPLTVPRQSGKLVGVEGVAEDGGGP